MANNKTILIISFSPLSRDPRVRRQIEFLRKNHNVIAVGLDDPQIKGVKYIKCNGFFDSFIDRIQYVLYALTKKFETYYWLKYRELYNILLNETYDLIISNDPETLPLASRLGASKNIKFLADMHEYSPREGEGNFKWEIFFKSFKKYLCSNYLHKASIATTVCHGIAKEYEKEFNLNNIYVITNAPDYRTNSIKDTDSNNIKLVHHGVATAQRKIENMLEMMDYVDDRFSLDIYLVPAEKRYFDNLKKSYSVKNNINFKEPVEYKNINDMLINYDIGLYILNPSSFNELYALPNKLFEFVQARLAVAIGPSIEMMQYVKKYQCGVVSGDFTPQAMADELNKLKAEDIDIMKKNSVLMAKEECAEKNMEKLETIIKTII